MSLLRLSSKIQKLIVLVPALAFAEGRFPVKPHLDITPGSLCEVANEMRYPEGIAYCRRNVHSEEKRRIMREYDEKFGYSVTQMPRQHFKIDHFVPLCMGGSNNSDNLWPQHQSVYQRTDRLEEVLCRLMSQGQMKQVQALDVIRRAKLEPETEAKLALDHYLPMADRGGSKAIAQAD
jgi:hypothetical protein